MPAAAPQYSHSLASTVLRLLAAACLLAPVLYAVHTLASPSLVAPFQATLNTHVVFMYQYERQQERRAVLKSIAVALFVAAAMAGVLAIVADVTTPGATCDALCAAVVVMAVAFHLAFRLFPRTQNIAPLLYKANQRTAWVQMERAYALRYYGSGALAIGLVAGGAAAAAAWASA